MARCVVPRARAALVVLFSILFSTTLPTCLLAQLEPRQEIRINCGGTNLNPPATEETWLSDASYYRGNTEAVSFGRNAAALQASSELYLTQRQGKRDQWLHYVFNLYPGKYDMVIHFIELESASPGARVFDVVLNGKPVVSNLDVLSRAGYGKPLLISSDNLVLANRTVLSFVGSDSSSSSSSNGRPMCTGIQLVRQQPPIPPPPPTPAPTTTPPTTTVPATTTTVQNATTQASAAATYYDDPLMAVLLAICVLLFVIALVALLMASCCWTTVVVTEVVEKRSGIIREPSTFRQPLPAPLPAPPPLPMPLPEPLPDEGEIVEIVLDDTSSFGGGGGGGGGGFDMATTSGGVAMVGGGGGFGGGSGGYGGAGIGTSLTVLGDAREDSIAVNATESAAGMPEYGDGYSPARGMNGEYLVTDELIYPEAVV